MQSLRSISYFFFLLISINSHAQNVGIGINNPLTGFHINGNRTVLFGTDSITTGLKFMYYGNKGAIRSGNIVNEGANVGDASATFGNSNTASGYSSFAAGNSNSVPGASCTAIGAENIVNGSIATAIGWNNQTSGLASIAIGFGNVSANFNSIAIGNFLTASGALSTAAGYRVSTNEKLGSYIIGDGDPNNQGITYVGFPNQFVARFANGYYLMTSGDQNRTGVQIAGGGNAWLSISDKNRKENFEVLNDEIILQKLAAISYSSWNYKGQDPTTFRHYGIMAQDFYNAFGKDSYGTIGCDTLVNPVDMQGIAFSAIKALEARTQKINELENKVATLEKLVLEMKERLGMK